MTGGRVGGFVTGGRVGGLVTGGRVIVTSLALMQVSWSWWGQKSPIQMSAQPLRMVVRDSQHHSNDGKGDVGWGDDHNYDDEDDDESSPPMTEMLLPPPVT